MRRGEIKGSTYHPSVTDDDYREHSFTTLISYSFLLSFQLFYEWR